MHTVIALEEVNLAARLAHEGRVGARAGVRGTIYHRPLYTTLPHICSLIYPISFLIPQFLSSTRNVEMVGILYGYYGTWDHGHG